MGIGTSKEEQCAEEGDDVEIGCHVVKRMKKSDKTKDCKQLVLTGQRAVRKGMARVRGKRETATL